MVLPKQSPERKRRVKGTTVRVDARLLRNAQRVQETRRQGALRVPALGPSLALGALFPRYELGAGSEAYFNFTQTKVSLLRT